MKSSELLSGVPMENICHSSKVRDKSSILNGLIPSDRLSPTLSNPSSLPLNPNPNQFHRLNNSNKEFKRSKRVKDILLIICLTLLLAFLFLITIELSRIVVQNQRKDTDLISLSVSQTFNSTRDSNETSSRESSPVESYFACVWLFNLLLFLICSLIHLFVYQRRRELNRARSHFLREFGGIFDNRKCSTSNTLVDYLIKICLLCLLWYLCCYLMFRSMSILVTSEIIILYSITITLREVLGWICLHEQFIGNKIIAHILALSALLLLAHNDGFRFNRFLLGLAMVTSSVVMKTTFDILLNSFVKDLTSSKLRVAMINVCLCGTCLFWPFVLLFHLTKMEPIENVHVDPLIFFITLILALVYNILLITIPIRYTSISKIGSLLLVIPSISLIDRYYFRVKYSSLVISATVCSFIGVLLSMIPKQWFQPGEAAKMKQALGLSNKDPNGNSALGMTGTGGTTSALDEIRAQRRIRNALLYNEMKT